MTGSRGRVASAQRSAQHTFDSLESCTDRWLTLRLRGRGGRAVARALSRRVFRCALRPARMPDGDFTSAGSSTPGCHRGHGRRMADGLPVFRTQPHDPLSELTKTPISRDSRKEPNTWVVAPPIRSCSTALTSSRRTPARSAGPEEVSVCGLPVEGRVLWVDDFWGTAAWEQWSGEIGACCPRRSIRLRCALTIRFFGRCIRHADSADHEHPVLAQLPGTRHVGARPRQRGSAPPRHSRSAWPHHGADDPQHRRRDSWEREGEDPGSSISSHRTATHSASTCCSRDDSLT
jgi:hypothetical protein